MNSLTVIGRADYEKAVAAVKAQRYPDGTINAGDVVRAVVESGAVVPAGQHDELRKAAMALKRACEDANGPVVPTPVAEAIARVTALGGQ